MTDSLKEKVILKLREKLPNSSETEITEYTERAEEYFKAKTNRLNVPVRAFYLWIDLALEMQKTPSGASSQGTVASVKRGDTTITYAENQATGLNAFASQLKEYRVAVAR